MSAPKVYLAGPGVFRPNAKQIGERLKRLCQHHGLEGLWPADTEVPPAAPGMPDTPFGRASFIYRVNLMMIAECAAVIADITPFRGPHMDVGTAFEIGRAHAQGKEIFAYVWTPAEPAQLIDRIQSFDGPDGKVDREGNLVEDFGLVENLMIALAVRPQIATSVEVAIRRCASFLKDSQA